MGGRRFGTVVTWFLLGGDLYTAYTFIAVPALMFGAGAAGFFAIPYAMLVYPLLFLVFPRLWSVAHQHGYVTAADFVRGRFGIQGSGAGGGADRHRRHHALYRAAIVGMQVVIAALGFQRHAAGCRRFPTAAADRLCGAGAYTYASGLRGAALIAVVKDLLIYVTILAAVMVIPAELGGYAKIFASIDPKTLLLGHGSADNLGPGFAYSSLALGSVLALFLYPHAVTGVLSSSSRKVVKRNAMFVPAYSFALALIALLGFMAVAAGVKAMPEYGPVRQPSAIISRCRRCS